MTPSSRAASARRSPPSPRSSPRVINIGLRGGLAKASTGYAFDAIQTFSAELAWATLAYAVRNGGPEVAAAVRALAEPLRAAAMAADDRTDATDTNELPPALLCRFLTDRGSPLDRLRVMASTPLGQMTAEALRSRARWLRTA